MSYLFPSDAWVKAYMQDLNSTPSYEEAAKNWEGDFYFIIEPGGALVTPVTLYMDLWHGKCRDAYQVVTPRETDPAYRLSAPVTTWKRVLTRALDPMQGMMTGQLKLRGNMAMVMKNVRAAKELVAACTRIPTEFPV